MVIKSQSELLDPEWKYKIILDNTNWPEIQDWCEKYIGEFDKDWYKLGIDPMEFLLGDEIKTTWLFKEEEKAVFFMLRWS